MITGSAFRVGARIFAAAILALAMTPTTASGQSGDVWFVFVNDSTSPATIGVATSRFNEPGWGKLSAGYGSDTGAWAAACWFHAMTQYHSPEIAADLQPVPCDTAEAAAAPGVASPTIEIAPDSGIASPTVKIVPDTGAATGETWFVYMTVGDDPAMIGVTTSDFDEPGWGRLSAAFDSDDEAWRAACEYDEQPEYSSPDIALGIVDCAALEGGETAAVAPTPPPCTGSFHGTWKTNYYGNTRIWVDGVEVRGEAGSERIVGAIEGCTLIGEWFYTNSDRRGSLSFTLSADGQSFSGTWSEPGGRQGVPWTGTKSSDESD